MTIEKRIASSRIVEVANRFPDNGGAIDAFVRIALVGIGLVAIEARVVIVSLETCLKYVVALGFVARPSAAVRSPCLVPNRARKYVASRPRRPQQAVSSPSREDGPCRACR